MTVKSLLLAGGAFLGGTSGALASGFQVYLPSQQSIGMGGVGVGLSMEQAAQFMNPGAMAMLRQNGVQVGASATFARSAFRSANGGEQRELQNTVVTPFNVYASFGPKEGKWRAGVSVYTPYGSQLKYADGWEGRFSLTEITLQSVYVQPTFSYAITDKLSIGAGLMILAYGSVNLQRDIALPSPYPEGHITLDGTTETAFGVNAGIFFKPSDKLSVGVSYRSKIDAKAKGGDVTVTGLPDPNTTITGALLAPRFVGNKFDATLPLPASVNIGLGIMPNDKLTIGLDVNWTQWSEYRALRFDFTKDGAPASVGDLTRTFSESKRNYEDALTFRLGGQYKVTDKLALRLGGAYDMTPVKDGYVTPETPDNDRIIGTAGIGYDITENLGVDASFMFQAILKRTQTEAQLLDNGTTDRVAGTYRTNISIPGIGVRYNF
ncbi:outer membrane protein transport protein [Hymenobacter sp. ASUV-10]|uniref:Outer membrane protein transport protein n=1 Tax=Hymenobacter aranciens TaxID=3063996 RepID=A0ABT9B6B5_9BACT|nr:outer membrane protein transport protein [Hymenobacter sp. ASUV-10]MDO7873249.1 outer membrane protein transport protein [Hymenobacter sp. ASUV-10]